MTPVQLFGIVVRTIGLLMTLFGAGASVLGLLAVFWGDPILLFIGIPVLLVGLWLVRGPEWLIGLAYPEEQGAARFYPSAAEKPSTPVNQPPLPPSRD
ncbi:MAG TPA: hypothetical protein VHY91_13990 [Pirellulales bacterium]|jgi:hypothetical protein|nr:hypothetical protein [Pirellulales bacterium]